MKISKEFFDRVMSLLCGTFMFTSTGSMALTNRFNTLERQEKGDCLEDRVEELPVKCSTGSVPGLM